MPDDVRAATGALSSQVLETLATRLRPLDSVAPPVLAPAAAGELSTLIALCRHRERLPDRVGAAVSSTLNRGVRALMSGPSGTGKTLAARYIGARLGLDVYRIDLAAVMSKYIGETERILHSLLTPLCAFSYSGFLGFFFGKTQRIHFGIRRTLGHGECGRYPFHNLSESSSG